MRFPTRLLSGTVVAAVAVLLFEYGAITGAQMPSGGGNEWISSVVESQKKLAKDMAQIKGTATEVFTNSLKQRARTREIEFAFRDQQLRYIETVVAEKVADPRQGFGVGFTSGYVFNPDGQKDSFIRFHRSPDHSHNFVLDDINKQGNSAKWQSLTSPLARKLKAPTSLADARLLDVLLHPTFKCLSSTVMADQGQSVLRIVFELAPTKNPNDSLREYETAMISGWFQVSPEKAWRLEKYELIYSRNNENGLKRSNCGSIDYGDNSSSHLPFKTAIRKNYGNGILAGRFELTLNSVSSEGVTDDLFDPTGFNFYKRKKNPRRVWLLVVASVGVLMVALGILLRRRSPPPPGEKVPQTESE